MNQVEVSIMGQTYTFACPEGDRDRLQEAARRVDEAMCKIRDSSKKNRPRDRIAVEVALNLAFDLSDPSADDPHENNARTGSSTTASSASSASFTLYAAKAVALMNRMDAALESPHVVGVPGGGDYRFACSSPVSIPASDVGVGSDVGSGVFAS